MAIPILNLPFRFDALVPVLSASSLQIHYEEHYKGDVNKLNDLVKNTIYEELSLTEIIQKSRKLFRLNFEVEIFNVANQAWNHEFFWQGLTGNANQSPSPWLSKKVRDQFDTWENFEAEFHQKSTQLFGSGWVWLVLTKNLKLEIVSVMNADNPFGDGSKPLLVIDVWEHAYYIDYHSQRAAYAKKVWSRIDWDFVERQLRQAESFQMNRSFYHRLFASPKTDSASAHLVIDKKTSIRSGTLVGALIGAGVFLFLAVLVNLGIIPLPGLTESAEASGFSMSLAINLFFGLIFGFIIGSVIGALVGIGTPMPLSTVHKTLK